MYTVFLRYAQKEEYTVCFCTYSTVFYSGNAERRERAGNGLATGDNERRCTGVAVPLSHRSCTWYFIIKSRILLR